MTIPYTYTDHLKYLENKSKTINSNINYIDKVLTLTPLKREVHLITITSNDF